MKINIRYENKQCQLSEHFYTKQDLDNIFSFKKIYIWGAGRDGKGVFHALKRNGYQIEAFMDRASVLLNEVGGGGYCGTPIVPPDLVLTENDGFPKQVFVILAIAKDRAAVIKRLENEGFVKGRDFLQRTDLCPVTPSIEISGVCNLKCLACPRSDTLHPFENGDFMNIDNYKKIIDKLVKEMPMLHMVGLQIWGDPLLHPKLPEILKINSDLGIVTDISTNLNIRTEKLEEIVKANPTYIRLSCSGFGSKHYEITHAGAKWELFYKNCAELSMLIKKYHVDTTVEIYFHINKMNIDEYKDIYSLVRQMGFRLNAVLSMIFPKYAMDFLKNIPLHDGAQKSKDLMWISLEEMLDSAQKDNAKPCPQRIGFPNINWDRSVLNCCNLTQDRLAGDFMNITLDELIKLKNNSDFCKECISYSLHRYVDLVKYMPYVQNLLLEKCNLPYYI